MTVLAGYRTGFCSVGQHEGKAPTSPSGRPMKICTAIDICDCPCHKQFDRMFAMAGEPRQVRQNPKYIPAENVDLSWIAEMRESDEVSAGDPAARTPVVVPDVHAPGLTQSARVWTTAANGGRARGQLEADVQRICNRKMTGEFIDKHLTPAEVALAIDPDNPPSSGAIGAVFDRWDRMGYAKIHRKPIYFITYTVAGMRDGLEKTKINWKRMGGR